MKGLNPVAALIFLFFLIGPSAQPQAQSLHSDITSQEIIDHISFLASDMLKGRRSGSAEAQAAAYYIKKQFLENNLVLLGKNGFQTLEVLQSLSRGSNTHLSVNQIPADTADFTPLAFSDNQELNAGVCFGGYGFSIQTDSITWQDVSTAEVTGKWTLIFMDGPPVGAGRDPYEAHRSLRKKAQTAKDNGAAGVLFVERTSQDKEADLIALQPEQGGTAIGIPVMQIRRSLAERILQESGSTLAELQERLDTSLQPAHLPLATMVHGQAEVIRRMGRTYNVMALLPGNDPQLKEEYVIIGAHYDHIGMGGPGSGSRRPDTLAVHNGADDNASGVAGLLEVAEKWASAADKPKRSLLFVAFTGEEMGLLGSKYFVNNPPIDLSRVQLMINLDMIGRLDSTSRAVTVGGTGTAEGLGELVQRLAATHALHPTLSPEGYGPSDHASFYAKDISVLFIWTNISEEYHTPADDVNKINAAGEEDVVKLVFDISREIANGAERLAFKEAGPKSQPVVSRRFKVTLGIMPDFSTSGVKGVRADAVIPNRPAALAGMHKGDIIVALEGKPVSDIYEYMNRLADLHIGQRISMEIVRDGVKQILIVDL